MIPLSQVQISARWLRMAGGGNETLNAESSGIL